MDTISAIRNIIRQGLSNAQGNSQYIKPRQDEGLGGSMGRILQLIGQSAQQDTPVGTPQGMITKFVGGYAEDVGQTLERLSSTQGRQQTIQGAQQLPQQFQQRDFISALQNPATQDALNVMDFLPVGAIAGGVKAVGGNKAVREAIEVGLKSKAGSNVAGEVLKRVGNKIDPLVQEARKYKSADEFVKAQEKLLSKDIQIKGDKGELQITQLYPQKELTGTGYVRDRVLTTLRDKIKTASQLEDDGFGKFERKGLISIKKPSPSGKSFMDKMVRDGYLTRAKSAELTPEAPTYKATQKLLDYKTTKGNFLTDIFNQAKKRSR